jgi:hypothetical protein
MYRKCFITWPNLIACTIKKMLPYERQHFFKVVEGC